MFIVVNKDFSLANITPSTVYQGSNLANELAIFAPFSISSYSAVEIAFMLPSGEYLTPSLAFPSVEQPDGFGAWSMLLPSTVTAIPGTVRLSLSFIGAGNSKMVTEAAEFTVAASVPSVMPETPSQDIYEQILSYVSEVSNRKPNWSETNPNADDYIANKPPISRSTNANGETAGATVDGNLNVDGSAFIYGNLNVNGVSFGGKLDKATVTGKAAYTVDGSEQGTTPITTTPTEGSLPAYKSNGRIAVGSPTASQDCVNKEYLDAQLREKVLPQWVNNLSTATSSTLIPPTSGAVIRYTAPAIVGTVSGTAVMIDDFSNITGQTQITVNAPVGSTIGIYGKNLLDITAVTAQVGNISVNSDSFTWTTTASATGTFFVKCPVNVPANTTFTFTFDWIAESSSDALGRVRFYNGNTEVGYTASGATRGTFTFDQPITQINIYKNPSNTNLVGAITVSKPTLNLGTLAEYTDYQSPTYRNTNSLGNTTFSPPFADGITIIPSTPSVVTATYTRDSTKVINKLFALIAEIQDAIAN